MKLLTHNLLTSRCLKGVQVGYPLKIVAEEVRDLPVDFNVEKVQRIIPKINWPVLQEAARTLNVTLPADAPQGSEDEETMRCVHHALFEVEVVRGELICPETGRKFPIKEGIPNLLCNEDEV